MTISSLAIDVSKAFFQLHGVNIRKSRGSQVGEPCQVAGSGGEVASCLIVMEATAARTSGRAIPFHDIKVKRQRPFCKPFVKGNKMIGDAGRSARRHAADDALRAHQGVQQRDINPTSRPVAHEGPYRHKQ